MCRNVGVSFLNYTILVPELRIFLFILLGFQVSLPVEEWLLALAMQPGDIVELKVMTIAMARINLPTKRKMLRVIKKTESFNFLGFHGKLDSLLQANAAKQAYELFQT